MNTTYQKFVDRWQEVMRLPVQQVGPLTPLYKFLVRRLKVMPWPALVAVSAALAVGLYLTFGAAISLLVSVLQRGF
ncbi:hypothetical protein A2Z33_07605 [Candidatus Gottesmanbacteria bacterium RBG_16_52_11]|uniref:Uncharacterized protein n=1 Tax=Candidatus Gottesmanbacteria bacterium RBG_16_52_11 TaxID=1798374 RepID=A0A1F5YNF0_9BACT|nr:MAG: hypothetical protein A2Z33_07605 [Candidatus Gottesmanbacteria bacterium RBG_16_52_11]